MISAESITEKWINEVSQINNKADKILIEKVIRALLLLEGLVENKFKFTFKGGTALMLHLNSSKRLSIDIDIVMHHKTELAESFNAMGKTKGFNQVDLQERKANYDIEKAHYKFYYTPAYKTGPEEDYILLDILFEQPKYEKIIQLPIDSTFVKQDGEPLYVDVPSLDDLLGDKLTAFAPNTSGIPYEKNGVSRTMEIMKQLYDIGTLFELSDDPAIITSTFKKFAITELGYRDLGEDFKIVLNDIYQTALLLCTRGKDGNGNYEAIQLGLRQIKGYIFSGNYTIEHAIIDASKAAYLAKLIEIGATKIQKFSDPSEIRDWIFEQPFNTRLNPLKKTNSEAFFYWYQIFLLEESAAKSS
jgi:hypothetical protein